MEKNLCFLIGESNEDNFFSVTKVKIKDAYLFKAQKGSGFIEGDSALWALGILE